MPAPGSSSVTGTAGLDPAHLRAVDDALARTVEQQAQTLSAVSDELTDLLGAVRGLMVGGKRLRAAFCLWGARAATGGLPSAGTHLSDETPPGPGVIEAAAALEMFHLGALVHDDVMDRSALRRGVPTVHRSFADLHRSSGSAGDADAFGDSVAVLVGDLCFTWADDLLDRAARSCAAAGRAATGVQARVVWERMRTQTLAGQFLDLVAQSRPDTTASAATAVLHYKSAKYTVEHPLVLGGALAEAPPALLDDYAAFGLRVGEAFQLRDDVLGVFGESAVTGKSTYDDVREGKRTVLVAYAEEAATPEQLGMLRRHLGDEELDAEGLAVVRTLLTDTGALERVEARIEHEVTAALARLERMPVAEDAREALAELTRASVWRTA